VEGDQQGGWKRWMMDNILEALFPQRERLLRLFIGWTPITQNVEHSWGWKSTNYSMNNGYLDMLADTHLPPKNAF